MTQVDWNIRPWDLNHLSYVVLVHNIYIYIYIYILYIELKWCLWKPIECSTPYGRASLQWDITESSHCYSEFHAVCDLQATWIVNSMKLRVATWGLCNISLYLLYMHIYLYIDYLLTKCGVCMGKYWPKVFVQIDQWRSEVCMKIMKGKYFPIQTEQTWLIRNLLYGFWFLSSWLLTRPSVCELAT